jgi:hypothetical protein
LIISPDIRLELFVYKRAVEKIASIQELRSISNYKQKIFWKAVREGYEP